MGQIAIVLYPGVTALDAIGPYEVLRFVPGAEVRFVGAEVGPVITDSGVLALGVTHTFAETPAPDVVVVPGGPAAFTLAADPQLVDWLRAVHETTTWTTSVCTGSLILAGAGLLRDRPATTHWAARSALALFGARHRDERMVRDDRIVTAAGVSAGIDMALWLVGETLGPERAEVIQLDIEYDPSPPFDSGSADKATAAVRRMAMADQARLARAMLADRPGATLNGMRKTLWQSAIQRMRR